MKNMYIIVPSYDPDEKIMNVFLKELRSKFKNILIVNDGSDSSHDKFFKQLERDGYEVITNYNNYGKGRAIKYAFNYLLCMHKNLSGVVTCDCDGQHTVSDIENIAHSTLSFPNSLILGVRTFKGKTVPLRSRFGNNVTKNIFKMFVGLSISDTQTGLRGFSKEIMLKFLDTNGERYEYETNVLMQCKDKNINIVEVPIETIYLNNNVTSHFNPIKDSIKIYKLFTKYILSSLSSFVIDLTLFALILLLLKGMPEKIIFATIIARMLSSIWNYYINANLVFKRMTDRSITMYYILVVVIMLLSALSVDYFSNMFNISIILVKILVDLCLFIFSYLIQKNMIFVKGVK